eukprot:TRINITY_DN1138_c0_g1_i1.p2 TRINITY_DN1138_c0_g1~~TRINITY_DN1138_c0_g1_i1.p2  ORF type:complete len:109 (+),score=10.30 TRINITY_DN1138_c0_g1_i1:71-397(+)
MPNGDDWVCKSGPILRDSSNVNPSKQLLRNNGLALASIDKLSLLEPRIGFAPSELAIFSLTHLSLKGRVLLAWPSLPFDSTKTGIEDQDNGFLGNFLCVLRQASCCCK